jgi:hypothetical protein
MVSDFRIQTEQTRPGDWIDCVKHGRKLSRFGSVVELQMRQNGTLHGHNHPIVHFVTPSEFNKADNQRVTLGAIGHIEC